ncbi:2-dehydro-3-deoxyphosphooctonate aldolase [Winogradskyella sp. J14-2]|uniref:2-dehydro-3-deoxyphosphooctonate aldolase n=1 Tax=Winogradskyella sp. J14-2 TaxID=1936080 RepID=UPI000972AD45|nr:2-dehydro-3-deoxyphosphooctonate aldolase [Winogradskyella sp. J14-2]APY09205.1 2-dehydro-3-deoxyphosphooctonate aldolase [Winogradskyella sp. J14-2]
MNRQILTLGIFSIFLSCASTKEASKNTAQILRDNSTFLVTEISTDKTYGYSPKNPVEVGGAKNSEGPRNERRFLNALAGPNGEKISYYRAGSCCPIKSSNDPYGFGSVMLDNYRVTWKNAKDTVSIYINMYDSSKLKAPVGFTIKE